MHMMMSFIKYYKLGTNGACSVLLQKFDHWKRGVVRMLKLYSESGCF